MLIRSDNVFRDRCVSLLNHGGRLQYMLPIRRSDLLHLHLLWQEIVQLAGAALVRLVDALS